MASINENSMVEKSRFLLGMKAPNYELGELKILDTYLARINARDPETKLVRFTKGEYERLMGLKQIKAPQLKKYTQAMLGKVVTIPYGKRGYEQYTLFTHARCDQDPETLEWTVELGCNEKLEQVFFNIEEAGYLRYRLRNILPLTSKYSVLFYLYFKDNIFRQTFEISLRELREKLGVEDNKTYESFKYFKRDIIDKCVTEINDLTDIDISYERKTRGRLTVGLVFNVKSKPRLLDDGMEQLELFDEEIPDEALEALEQEDDIIAFYRTALKDDGKGLTDEQIDELQLAAKQSAFGSSLFPMDSTERDIKLHSYIMAQDRYTRSRAPKKYFNYLLDAVKNDYAKYSE